MCSEFLYVVVRFHCTVDSKSSKCQADFQVKNERTNLPSKFQNCYEFVIIPTNRSIFPNAFKWGYLEKKINNPGKNKMKGRGQYIPSPFRAFSH